jgi:hypothetical protein
MLSWWKNLSGAGIAGLSWQNYEGDFVEKHVGL